MRPADRVDINGLIWTGIIKVVFEVSNMSQLSKDYVFYWPRKSPRRLKRLIHTLISPQLQIGPL
jgi:hypothetical protein